MINKTYILDSYLKRFLEMITDYDPLLATTAVFLNGDEDSKTKMLAFGLLGSLDYFLEGGHGKLF